MMKRIVCRTDSSAIVSYMKIELPTECKKINSFKTGNLITKNIQESKTIDTNLRSSKINYNTNLLQLLVSFVKLVSVIPVIKLSFKVSRSFDPCSASLHILF